MDVPADRSSDRQARANVLKLSGTAELRPPLVPVPVRSRWRAANDTEISVGVIATVDGFGSGKVLGGTSSIRSGSAAAVCWRRFSRVVHSARSAMRRRSLAASETTAVTWSAIVARCLAKSVRSDASVWTAATNRREYAPSKLNNASCAAADLEAPCPRRQSSAARAAATSAAAARIGGWRGR